MRSIILYCTLNGLMFVNTTAIAYRQILAFLLFNHIICINTGAATARIWAVCNSSCVRKRQPIASARALCRIEGVSCKGLSTLHVYHWLPDERTVVVDISYTLFFEYDFDFCTLAGCFSFRVPVTG